MSKSPRNKTLSLEEAEIPALKKWIIDGAFEPVKASPKDPNSKAPKDSTFSISTITNKIINGDLFATLPLLPKKFADLIIIDPPYNLGKDFHGNNFKARSNADYQAYIESWLPAVLQCAKDDASVYVCCEWKSSSAIFSVLEAHCLVQNRITWQREKGRKALSNWKNCSEDIWFATMGKDFYFDPEAVLHKKKVLAPYKEDGKAKDWSEDDGGKFRLTGASNFWDDITVPYWSMKENTEHPTQKPEKLLAKLILASSRSKGLIFDPFAGSGSTAVAATKLGRAFATIEQNLTYCLWAAKRLEQAQENKRIQGYEGGVFLPRNV